MTIYKECVYIEPGLLERVNRLLDIKSLEEMSDKELLDAGANTDQCEGIFSVTFDDGSSLNYDLCSGQSNYYDDVVWTSASGDHDIVLECSFELDDIEFDVDGVGYIVTINHE